MIKDIKFINQMVEKGTIRAYIKDFEHAFDTHIRDIAQELKNNLEHNRIVLVSGPSSSGKTTFTLKLEQELDDMGLEAETISMDDFYLDRAQAPKKADGKPDFETVYSLDLPEMRRCFEQFVKEGGMEMPHFSFKQGRRVEQRRHIPCGENTILLVEGMHALSDVVGEYIPNDTACRIFISIRSSLDIGDDVLLDSRNLRLLRRLIRDYKFRGSAPDHTLQLWLDVIAGDILYVEPFESRADIMVNSFFPYEAGVLKPTAQQMLTAIPKDSIFYHQCRSILERLEYVSQIDTSFLPSTSLLREFVGDSIYY